MSDSAVPEQLAFEAGLTGAVDHLPYGLAVFDSELRLATANTQYRIGMGLPQGLVLSGTPLDDILLFMARRGDLGPGTPQVVSGGAG